MVSEFLTRTEKLSEILNKKNIDVALIMQNADLYYYSGTIPSGVLCISKENKILYAVKKGLKRAIEESPIKQENIVQITGFKNLPNLLKDFSINYNTIGLEMDVVPAEIYLKLKGIFKDSEIIDVSSIIRWQRAIKSQSEIETLKQSARLLDCTIEDAKDVVREGKTELEVCAELEFRARKRGHQGLDRMRSFNGEMLIGHVHSGANSAYPSPAQKPTAGKGLYPSFPEGETFDRIKENVPIIVDFLGNYRGYMTDETRTFVIGKLSDKFKRAYETCLEIMNFVEKEAKPGVIAQDLYYKALEIAEKRGFKDNFMGAKGNQVSFIGHGIGLELDEFPVIAKGQNYALEENMVFALEPKIAFYGEGAVGIENTYVVTKDGLEILTKYPKEIVVL